MKSGQIPGFDEITNECFEALPDNWLRYIKILFNKILNEETIPKTWSEIALTMLYKKAIGTSRSITVE